VGRRVEAALAATDNRIPRSDDLERMEADLSRLLSFARFRATLLGSFALTAILLAAFGLHGVLAQLVSQRTAEFGIRLAIGAKPRRLFTCRAARRGTDSRRSRARARNGFRDYQLDGQSAIRDSAGRSADAGRRRAIAGLRGGGCDPTAGTSRGSGGYSRRATQ